MVKLIRRPDLRRLSVQYACTFDRTNKPIARVKTGELLDIETLDAYGALITPAHDLKSALTEGPLVIRNPITGPLFVEGAEPGDALVVEILKISLPGRGVTLIKPASGGLEGWPQGSEALTKFSDITEGIIDFVMGDGRAVPLAAKPFIGTVGVAPAFGSIASIVPGRHGGNLDSSDICVGNKLILPVAVRGALFGLGDVHALQGDAEICGTAVEVSSKVRIRLGLMKGKAVGWPRIEAPSGIIVLGSGKPLEDAARHAFREMMEWLRDDYKVDTYDAYMLLSLTAEVRVAQMVNPLYTVSVKLPEAVLKHLGGQPVNGPFKSA